MYKFRVLLIFVMMFLGQRCFGSDFKWDPKYDTAISNCSREDILRTFEFAVHFSTEFGAAEYGDSNYDKMRAIFESFQEVILSPVYRQSIQLLKKENDNEIMKATLKLLVAYQNSADEYFAEGLFDVYLNNPDLVEENLKYFEEMDQICLVVFLEESPHFSDKANTEIKTRVEKLKKEIEKNR